MRKSAKLYAILLFSVLAILPLSGCSKSAFTKTETVFALDTVISVTYYDEKDGEAVKGALSLLQDNEKIFSAKDPESELCRLNERILDASSDADVTALSVDGERTLYGFSVSDALYALLEKALSIAKLDIGFDITLGRISDLYGFGTDSPSVPSDDTLSELLSHTGSSHLSLSDGMLFTDDRELAIDLGGIAKGYIGDLMKAYMVEKGVESALLNLGGNILSIGEKPGAGGASSPFTVGISYPEKDSADYITTVSVSGEAVATSGSYQRYFEKDGVRYHHILDPKTGKPAKSGVLSASVIAPDAATSDALSTAFFVSGMEKEKALLALFPDVEVIFIDESLQVLSLSPKIYYN